MRSGKNSSLTYSDYAQLLLKKDQYAILSLKEFGTSSKFNIDCIISSKLRYSARFIIPQHSEEAVLSFPDNLFSCEIEYASAVSQEGFDQIDQETDCSTYGTVLPQMFKGLPDKVK